MTRADTVVTFAVAGSLFAVEVGIVREILSAQAPSRLPGSPPHLLGLIDVRGASVPLVDLCRLLGEVPEADDDDTRIMVLTIEGQTRDHTLALRVDRVIEVCGLDNDGEVLPVAEAEMVSWDPRVLHGIGRREGGIVAMLNILAVFDTSDLTALDRSADPSEALTCAP
ncbi:chemotaxis protein CheW [Salipiger sp.]|uniref:chemotaxis protein CheW n=1 Tax=Salipiger sp. TaxID=2078585 RepID=UPI003A97759C